MEQNIMKIYNDGGHFIAFKPTHRKSIYKDKKIKTKLTLLIEELCIIGLNNGHQSFKYLLTYVKQELFDMYCLENTEELTNLIIKVVKRTLTNLHKRKNRFRRKANLNKWNYFVTFTYSDKLHTAQSFRKKLRKCLSNLHTRRGWRFMGVFELSPEKQRLHFHCLCYIPNGEMIGELFEKTDYSICDHKMQTANVNTFFLDTFGRNDFTPIETTGTSVEYILKYLHKTNERIVYSRGIATEIIKQVSSKDIACSFFDFIDKFVLYDNVIDLSSDIYNDNLVLKQDIPISYSLLSFT